MSEHHSFEYSLAVLSKLGSTYPGVRNIDQKGLRECLNAMRRSREREHAGGKVMQPASLCHAIDTFRGVLSALNSEAVTSLRAKKMKSLLLCLTSCLLAYGAGEELDLKEKKGVLILQQSQLPNIKSFAVWDGNLQKSLSAFTLCYRIKIYYYRPEVTVFSYIDTQFKKIRTDHNRRGVQVIVNAHGFRIQTNIITPLMHWAAFCFALDATDGFYAIYFNGEKWETCDVFVRMLMLLMCDAFVRMLM
ncbi:uncharacterized protein [Penaeus vannamei]|uniref:uncharacterized protein n=1 Tax=Penaeus vannamei TaxID=6689 RepID=UPI00387F519E